MKNYDVVKMLEQGAYPFTYEEVMGGLREGEIAVPGWMGAENLVKIDGNVVTEKMGIDGSKIDDIYKKTKWRIFPQILTFEEAMAALKKNKEVIFYYKEQAVSVTIDTVSHVFDLELREHISFNDMIHGKWTLAHR
jgi:hypothetical protein